MDNRKFFNDLSIVALLPGLFLVFATMMMVGNDGGHSAALYLIFGWLFFVLDFFLMLYVKRSQNKYKELIIFVLLVAFFAISLYNGSKALLFFN